MSRRDSSLRDAVDVAIERIADAVPERAGGKGDPPPPLNRILASAVTAAGAAALQRWARRRRPPARRLLRGAAAGAGAGALLAAVRALASGGTATRDVVDELLAGAGKGAIYAALLDPILPGPPAVRGALLGTAEYLAAPWGGVLGHLRSLSPVDRLPVVGALLEAGDGEEDPYLAFLLYGVALGLLTGDPD